MAESVPIKDANAATVAVATDTVVIGGETVIAQRIKAGHGMDGLYYDATDDTPLPVGVSAIEADYSPQYGAATETVAKLRVDPSGNLLVRAQVHGDEGGYRTNFSGTSLAVPIGTCTFTQNSPTVVGTLFDVSQVHLGDFVYLDADGYGQAVQVDYITPTEITLKSPYLGAGGTGTASAQILLQKLGAGTGLVVANGQATASSGTTSNAVLELERDADFLPITKLGRFSISQRIANQSIRYGFYDENPQGGGNARWWFRFDYNGTDPTKVDCVCAWNATGTPSGAEIRTATVTLPNGATSATSNDHRIELIKDRVVFIINGVIVCIETGTVPGPMDYQTSTLQIVNGTSPASNTNVILDYDACSNVDILPVEISSQSNQPVLQSTASDAIPGTASAATPSLSFGMQFDVSKQVWSRNQGNATQGQLVYSDDMAAIFLKMTQLLNALNAKLPPISNYREMPVRMTTQSTVNLALAGTAISAGAGGSGNSSARITPANDTVAGAPHIYALHASYTATRVQAARQLITT